VETTLLGSDEPPAFAVQGSDEHSPFVIVCDHAGARLPRRLGSLGLSARELDSHIAWDIGAVGVAQPLACALGAFLVWQPYSRLVIDCNRPLDATDSIAGHSGGMFIPGNANPGWDEARARTREIFQPYHAVIRAELDRRKAADLPTVFVSIHSFTPVLLDKPRPWHIGVLSHRDERLALPLLSLLHAEGDLVVGHNEPYAAQEASDYSLIEHGEKRGLVTVELEIRQDLIATLAGQMDWAARLVRLLVAATTPLLPMGYIKLI
jgi:predicted N-formylglutamate amidohydrolase